MEVSHCASHSLPANSGYISETPYRGSSHMSDVKRSALGELEVLSGFGLSVLLALNHTVVTGKQIV